MKSILRLSYTSVFVILFKLSNIWAEPRILPTVWTPGPNYYSYVIPQAVEAQSSNPNSIKTLTQAQRGESQFEAFTNYLLSVRNDPDFRKFVPLYGINGDLDPNDKWDLVLPQNFSLKIPQPRDLRDPKLKPRILAIASKLEDHRPMPNRLDRILPSFQKNGFDISVLPVGGLLRFDDDALKVFFSELEKHQFSLILFMGGNDIAPSLYGQSVLPKGSINFNERLDREEVRIVQTLKAYLVETPNSALRGLGICRGSQLISVAHGCQLYQDLATYAGATIKHDAAVPHPINTVPMAHNPLNALLRLPPAWHAATVNNFKSYHHQGSVDHLPAFQKHFEVLAYSPDHIVEFFQSLDRLFMGAQFHFEENNTGEGDTLIRSLRQNCIELMTANSK